MKSLSTKFSMTGKPHILIPFLRIPPEVFQIAVFHQRDRLHRPILEDISDLHERSHRALLDTTDRPMILLANLFQWMEGKERELYVRETVLPTSVEELPIASKALKVEQKTGGEVKKSVEDPGTSGAKSKKTCELQISEDLDEFVESSSETGEKNPRPTLKPTKRIVEAKPAAKGGVTKKKPEPKSLGPMKEEESAPWNGITLNRCLVVAAIAALLSMGFQVLQDVVDTDEELNEVETEPWTPPDPNDNLTEPWFFEGWFGSSEAEEPELPELELLEEEEELLAEDESVEEELEEVEELVEEELAEDEPTEDESASIPKTPPDSEKKAEETVEKLKKSDQWGLKAKNKYMEVKAIKIRRAEEGSQRREAFPFAKKPKDSSKPSYDYKDKPYKDKSNYRKDEERRSEHPKKQREDDGKPYKKGREEPKKYYKQEGKEKYKGWKEEKESKGFKHHQQDKDYKKQQDTRRHG